MKKICFLTVMFFAVATSGHAQVVISQVYGGAGCGTAGCSTYQNDFIEIFNRGTTTVDLTGWSVQYAAATGTTWQVTPLSAVMLAPGKYLLVSESFGANGVNPLPTPDVTGTIAMSATAGKVALVNSTVALTGACPGSATIMDFVGYGATANCNEGGANAPAPSTTTADIRASNGCTDAGNNSTDFSAAAPTPRNNSAAAAPCSALPVGFNNIHVFQITNAVKVEWSNLTETDVATYSVERSADGRSFVSIGSVNARLNDGSKVDYSFVDVSPLIPVSYYRINATGLNASNKYSIVVKVDMKASGTGITIYPNPVMDRQVSLQATGLIKGQYTIRVFDANGRQVLNKLLDHHGGSITEVIQLPATIDKGIYSIQLSGGEVKLSKTFIVQ